MFHVVRRVLPALLLGLVATASAAAAAVYIPTKGLDTNDGSCDANDCSLREAVVAANQHAGEDVILLRTGVYTLAIGGTGEDAGATGDLDITGDLVLLGDGADRSVIHGNLIDSILHVQGGATVEIRDMTLRSGRSQGGGGAILNNGVLTILRSELNANVSSAGAQGAGFGGAIYSDGDQAVLTLRDSSLANNSSQGGGGAIAAGGRLDLANVTISNNQSQSDFGGGLYIFSDARATLNNVTIVRNSAAQKGGGAFIENSAFIGTPPEITNTILAANTAPSDPDCSGAFSSRYNLIGIGAGCVGPSAANNDRVGTAASPLDPKLTILDLNGGPTRTAVPVVGSPALNSGSPAPPGSGGDSCEATDQRGAQRGTAGAGRCDIGAVEVTTACVPGGSNLCLNNGRFRVSATFEVEGETRTARGVTLTPESGYFYFFDASNVELTVKVLNGCPVTNHFWVFVSGLTNVGVTFTVEDTKTGVVKTYTNPAGRVFRTRLDINAFNTCSA